ncbi:Mbeg1-like protein [Aeromonas veronii]|uniref:Mbeg1-like protein n=1 Tax=Aeromonas veronii TaxID=654 RepID=UPI003D29A47A
MIFDKGMGTYKFFLIKMAPLFFIVISLSSCSLFPSNMGREKGFVWCNARYLDLTSPAYKNPNTVNPNNDKRFRLAYEGYIYALLGAVVLQKEQEHEDKHFNLPGYIEVDSTRDDQSGFQASAFKVYANNDKTQIKEIVIAFRGTDQFWRDYSKHNLSPFPEQYKPAEDYVLDISSKYSDSKIVVTGYSLGGGLAMHVLHNKRTTSKISQAWAFNSSPRTGEKIKVDSRLFLISAKGEILDLPRRILREGPRSLGALDSHFSDDYNLVDASSIYLHSRWVLARQMLIFADMVYFEKSGRQSSYISPPLEILKLANTAQGCTEEYREFLIRHGRL